MWLQTAFRKTPCLMVFRKQRAAMITRMFSTPLLIVKTQEGERQGVGEIVPSEEELQLAVTNPRILAKYMHPEFSEEDHFHLQKEVRIADMLKAGVHYGHKIGTLEENMKWAVYGERLGVCIFDLDITRRYMLRALNFLANMSYMGAVILFVTTQRSQILMVEQTAKELGQYAHCRRWPERLFQEPEANYGAKIRLPDCVIFLNTQSSVLEQHPALLETAKMSIPSIAIVDSNAQPNYAAYVIPGNDDSVDACAYYLRLFSMAIRAGQQKAEAEASEFKGHKMIGKTPVEDRLGA